MKRGPTTEGRYSGAPPTAKIVDEVSVDAITSVDKRRLHQAFAAGWTAAARLGLSRSHERIIMDEFESYWRAL